jgi:hypothetical protein
MGEAFIAEKKKSFEHKRDLAKDRELKTETLLSRLPDQMDWIIRCKNQENKLPQPGTEVILAELESDEVCVLDRNQKIGRALPKDKMRLLSFMRKSAHKMLAGTIIEVDLATSLFKVRVTP